MNSLQNTPSVYFAFEDTARKTQLSSETFFQLSCTNAKQTKQNPIMFNLKPVPLDLEVPAQTQQVKIKVKTQEFFEEFQKNFVVTFEEEHKLPSQVSSLPEHSRQQITEPDNETSSKISLSLCKPIDSSNDRDHSLEKTKVISSKDEKSSPIPSFEVKKRTVFKSKQNIQENALNFKLTKKKIYNKDTLEVLKGSCNSCKIGEPEKSDRHLFLTLKAWKAGDLDTNQVSRRSHKSTIFQKNEKENREIARSSTLQNWKKKFQKKKSLQEKTIKGAVNIFSRPSSRR